MFNLSEAVRARYLVENVILGDAPLIPASPQPSTSDSSTWTSIAARMAVLAFVYGAFFAVKKKFCPDKKDALVSARWISQRKSKELGGTTAPTRGSDEEVCPICLDPPKSGVRAGCGHRLCARCLRSYCESHLNKRNRPPPCPLCRTPLVSVTLTYDQINLLSSDCDNSDCTVDPATAKWIRNYNAKRGIVNDDRESSFLVKNTMTVIKLLLASLFIGIVARFQSLYGIDLVAYSTYFVTVFGMILIICLWFKSKEQAEYEDSS